MGLWRLLALSAVVFLLVPVPVHSARKGKAYIDGVQLSRGDRGELVLDFRVEKALDERILDTLDSGLPVRFTYWVQVVRPREFVRDEVLVDRRLERVLEKDNLKDRFRVTLEAPGEGGTYSSLAEAVSLMTRVEGLSLLPLTAIGDRPPLLLRIKAQLQKFQLPFRLHYLFAFVSYWDVETDWYNLELPSDPQALK